MRLRWVRLLAAVVVFGGSALWWRQALHTPGYVTGSLALTITALRGNHAALFTAALAGVAFAALFPLWLLRPLFFPRRHR